MLRRRGRVNYIIPLYRSFTYKYKYVPFPCDVNSLVPPTAACFQDLHVQKTYRMFYDSRFHILTNTKTRPGGI